MNSSLGSFIIFLPVYLGTALLCAERAPAQEAHFDVCDVSFLIPPSERSIHIAGEKGRKPLLSRNLFMNFEDFLKRGHPQLTADEVYEKLVVTGIRFDPCGPKYPEDWDLGKCILPNLRVIAQVYKDGYTTNAALHMVFLLRPLSELSVVDGKLLPRVALDPKLRDDVISRLASMKSSNASHRILTNGVPAGVHPVYGHRLSDSPQVRDFDAGLLDMLENHCEEARYFFTAVMFTDEIYEAENPGKDRWVWQKANIDRSTGQILFRFGGIPGFDPQLREQSLSAERGKRGGGVISPPSTLPENGVKNAAMAAMLSEVQYIDQTAFSSAIHASDRLENPDRVLVQTDECASCHVTTTTREFALHSLSGLKVDRSLRYEFTADRRLTSVLDDTQYMLQRSNGYRVLSFAFFNGTPSVSQRTVNESLQAAHVVNLLRK